ncbi:hypothetical protein ES703_86075 [subsurface metagenome]
MEKYINKDWTPEQEAHYQEAIDNAPSWGTRFDATSLRNTMKYNHRRIAAARRKVNLLYPKVAIATDDELKELAELRSSLLNLNSKMHDECEDSTAEEELERLTKLRAEAQCIL